MALHATVDRALKGKSPLYGATRHRGQGRGLSGKVASHNTALHAAVNIWVK